LRALLAPRDEPLEGGETAAGDNAALNAGDGATAVEEEAAVEEDGAAVAQGGGEAEGADPQLQPQWTYSCRKCSTALFHDLNVLPHHTDGAKKASRGWVQESSGGQAACTSMFVEPMKWMGCLEGQTGRLVCGNPACRQKLGGFSWHGLPCSCGQWQSPAFQIHCARLDCMPAGRRARGPAPQAVFRQ